MDVEVLPNLVVGLDVLRDSLARGPVALLQRDNGGGDHLVVLGMVSRGFGLGGGLLRHGLLGRLCLRHDEDERLLLGSLEKDLRVAVSVTLNDDSGATLFGYIRWWRTEV